MFNYFCLIDWCSWVVDILFPCGCFVGLVRYIWVKTKWLIRRWKGWIFGQYKGIWTPCDSFLRLLFHNTHHISVSFFIIVEKSTCPRPRHFRQWSALPVPPRLRRRRPWVVLMREVCGITRRLTVMNHTKLRGLEKLQSRAVRSRVRFFVMVVSSSDTWWIRTVYIVGNVRTGRGNHT